ncbi:hypothetical protein ACI3EY_06065 [Ornithinimicrobium sp. LYQ92]|uniref:hypothetical protein n=1 Tax=Serinicoccus sp. LYQ92 TaxID=3378798 RepID=UPI0038520EA2
MTPPTVPLVTVDGVDPALVARDLTRVVVRDRGGRPVRLRVELRHSPEGHVHPSGADAFIGSSLRVTLATSSGPDTAGWEFEGPVDAVSVLCPEGGPPMLILEAHDAREVQPAPPAHRSSTAIPLQLGQGLIAAGVRTEAVGAVTGGGPRPGLGNGVSAEAVTVPGLTVGGTVVLAGVASWVDGRAYRITAVRHRFDGVRGSRTRFRAEPV